MIEDLDTVDYQHSELVQDSQSLLESRPDLRRLEDYRVVSNSTEVGKSPPCGTG